MKCAANTTPLEGAYNTLFCATSPLAPTHAQGKFVLPVGRIEPKADRWLNDLELNAKLWNQTATELERLERSTSE